MSYNTAGCVTEINQGGNTKLLTWDSRYRLTAVYTNGSLAESYTYDAFDRRTSISDGVVTNFLIYNGLQVIAEVGTSGSLVRSYTYGPGIDNILSMTIHGGTTNTYYYIKDHLGSVLALTDSSGSIIES
jgi:YD repeat-containing protein